jgi:protein SCO1/2
MNLFRKILLVSTIGSAALLAACDKSAPPGPKVSFNAVDITGASYASKLDLPDVDGKSRTLADFKGKVTVVFFGYTQCPDVCPTTLAQMAEVRRMLGPDADKLQTVFVSVDPERDTAEILKAYMHSFDDSFVALRGSAEQTAEVAREFKVIYQKVPGKTPGSYTMDHTAASYVFDPQGRIRLYVRYNTPVADLAKDLKNLIAGA